MFTPSLHPPSRPLPHNPKVIYKSMCAAFVQHREFPHVLVYVDVTDTGNALKKTLNRNENRTSVRHLDDYRAGALAAHVQGATSRFVQLQWLWHGMVWYKCVFGARTHIARWFARHLPMYLCLVPSLRLHVVGKLAASPTPAGTCNDTCTYSAAYGCTLLRLKTQRLLRSIRSAVTSEQKYGRCLASKA